MARSRQRQVELNGNRVHLLLLRPRSTSEHAIYGRGLIVASLAVTMLLGSCGRGSGGTSYPCNGSLCAATGGANSGGASGAGEAGAGGSGGAPDGSGGMAGDSGSGGDAGPTCVVGQTYCTKTTLPPFFSLTPNYQGLCESVRTDCASNPTCACLCAQGRCCLGGHFSSCNDDGGLVTAFCNGI